MNISKNFKVKSRSVNCMLYCMWTFSFQDGAKSHNSYTNLHPRGKQKKFHLIGFLGGSLVKNPPASAGDMGSLPDLERSHLARSD